MAELFPRLRHVCDLDAAYLREYSGLHDEYDGTIVDLSPSGVASALAALGGPALDDAHDEAQLAATENAMRTRFGRIRQHRWDPWVHIEALDLSSYDRPYADGAVREEARRRHLRLWPDAVDNAIEALDELSSSVAGMFLPAARGMAAEVREDDGEDGVRALAALARLTAHLEYAAREAAPAMRPRQGRPHGAPRLRGPRCGGPRRAGRHGRQRVRADERHPGRCRSPPRPRGRRRSGRSDPAAQRSGAGRPRRLPADPRRHAGPGRAGRSLRPRARSGADRGRGVRHRTQPARAELGGGKGELDRALGDARPLALPCDRAVPALVARRSPRLAVPLQPARDGRDGRARDRPRPLQPRSDDGSGRPAGP